MAYNLGQKNNYKNSSLLFSQAKTVIWRREEELHFVYESDVGKEKLSCFYSWLVMHDIHDWYLINIPAIKCTLPTFNNKNKTPNTRRHSRALSFVFLMFSVFYELVTVMSKCMQKHKRCFIVQNCTESKQWGLNSNMWKVMNCALWWWVHYLKHFHSLWTIPLVSWKRCVVFS